MTIMPILTFLRGIRRISPRMAISVRLHGIYPVVVLTMLGCGGNSAPDTSPTPTPAPAPVQPASKPPAPRWLEFNMLRSRPLAVAPDGQRVLVQAGCETVLYDLTSGKRLHGWIGRAGAARFSGDGRCLLMVRKRNDVVLWDVEQGVQRRRFTGRTAAWKAPRNDPPRALAAVNHDASQVAITNCGAAFDPELPQAILVHDVKTGQLQKSLPMPDKATISSIEFLPHRDQLLVRFLDWGSEQRQRTIQLWDTQTGDVVVTFPPGEFTRTSRDGRRIATGALLGIGGSYASRHAKKPDSTRLTLWDTETGEAVRTFTHAGPSRDFTFDPTGERLLAALRIRDSGDGVPPSEGRLIEWQVATGEIVFEGFPSEKPYATVAYGPSGVWRFATTEEPNGVDDDVDHHLHGWNVATGEKLPIDDYLFASYNGDENLFFFPDGDRFIDLSAAFEVRDTLTGKTLKTLPEYRGPITEAAFAPDGEKFLVGQMHWLRHCLLTDRTTGEQRKWSLNGQQRYTFVEDGRTLFSADHSGVYLTDVASGKVYWYLPLEIHYGLVDAVISPDTRRIAVAYRIDNGGASDARLTLLETSRPDAPVILRRGATALAAHPEGDRFLAATEEGLEVIEFESGESLGVAWSPPGRVLCLAYSADGRQVIAGGVTGHDDWREPVTEDDSGWAVLYDIATKEALPLDGHAGPVTTAEFSRDASRCVTGSQDRTIRLWDAKDGREINVFRGHLGPVRRVVFSPSADSILSVAEDGAAMWNAVQFDEPPDALADSFEIVESIKAFPPPSHGRSSSTDSPRPRRSSPALGQSQWSVIEVGDVNHGHLPWGLRNWLSQAKATRHHDAAKPPRTQGALYGYKLCGTSRDGRRSVRVSMGANQVVLVDEREQIQTTWEGRPNASHVAISSSGEEVAMVRRLRSAEGERFEIHVFDSDSGKLRRVIDDLDTWYINSIKIDPKEETILLQVNNNNLELRDFKTGEFMAAVENSAGGAGLLSVYSPNGRYIVASKYPDTVVYLRDPKTLDVVQTLRNRLPVRWFRFTPDGQRLLVGQPYTRDGRTLLTMWDLSSGRELWSHAGPGGRAGTFSADGRLFLSEVRSRGELWALWDLTRGVPLCAVLTPGPSPINLPVLSPEGDALYRGSIEGPKLWTVPSTVTSEP